MIMQRQPPADAYGHGPTMNTIVVLGNAVLPRIRAFTVQDVANVTGYTTRQCAGYLSYWCDRGLLVRLRPPHSNPQLYTVASDIDAIINRKEGR